MIQTLVERSAERTGSTVEQARTALSAALFLIDKHAEPACVKDLFASVPGSRALAEQGAALGQNKAGGLVAG
jgi:hypothetical protein